MAGLRTSLKAAAERALVGLGVPRMLRAAGSGDAVILVYHNVVPDGAPPGGDRSLHLERREFARQLDLLTETHTVVGLETVLGGASGGRPAGPLAAVTIDDGYRGALTVGLEELRVRSLPCTVFVAPALLGSEDLWWDALAPGGEDGLPDRMREEALGRAKGRSGDVWRWAEDRGLSRTPQPPHAGLVDREELERVVDRGGVGVGSHGWSHADLTSLDDAELEKELRRPLSWLEERFPDALVRWLSLPYGRGGERALAAARAVGYRGVLDLSGGLVDTRTAATRGRAPRRNVPAGVSPEGFLLRTSGL